MKKRTLLLLFLFGLCVLLVSCYPSVKKPNDTVASDSSTDESGGEFVPEPDPLTLIEGGVSKYEIIYPSKTNADANTAANNLRAAFASETGITLPISDDYLAGGKTYADQTHKILIGPTDYPISKELKADLRYDDYIIAVNGTNMVVIAFHMEGYAAAIGYLKNQVFSNVSGTGSERKLVMSGKTVVGSVNEQYPVSSWKIAGNELKNYRIVYGNNNLTRAVDAMRVKLAEASGYYLDIALDVASEPQDCEILIGDTNRPVSAQVNDPTYLNYVFRVVGDRLVIKTGGEHSLDCVLRDFVEIVTNDATQITMGKTYELRGDYYTDPYDVSPASGSDLRAMSLNIMAEWPNYGGDQSPVSRRKEIFFSALDFYSPTVIGLQEFSPSFYSCLAEYRDAGKWDILKFNNPNVSGEYVASTVMYRKDLYTLVNSGMQYYSQYNNGRCRCITWAVLRDKTSGKTFCFISTHWDGDSSANAPTQLAEMVSFVNSMAATYPVITTGDFNSNEWTNSFKNLLSQTNSVDAKYAAEVALNNIGSWHDFGKDTPSAGSCDHITATKSNVKVLKFETMMYNEEIYCSDHAWLFADLKILA